MNDPIAPTVAELWQRWQAWLENHARDLAEELRDPAAGDAIAAAEEGLGLTFPEEFKASLAVHDGAELVCEVQGVRLGPDWDEQVAEQLRVGLHRDKWDSGPADWLIRAWKALPPAGRERLSDAVHRALLHAEPEVRLGALSTLDMCSKMGQPDKLLKVASEHLELFRGLRKRNDPPDRDRGRTLVRLTAALVEGDQGRAFRRVMAYDPVYGAGVLAAQARRDPEWLLDHLRELLDPALDPRGHRLDVLVFNFRVSAGRLRRLLEELSDRDRWPAERCAKALREHVRDEELLREILALLEFPEP